MIIADPRHTDKPVFVRSPDSLIAPSSLSVVPLVHIDTQRA